MACAGCQRRRERLARMLKDAQQRFDARFRKAKPAEPSKGKGKG